MLHESHNNYYIFLHACIYGFSSVIVLGFKYWTVKFAIIFFVIIIRIVVGLVLIKAIIIIIRLFQCNRPLWLGILKFKPPFALVRVVRGD